MTEAVEEANATAIEDVNVGTAEMHVSGILIPTGHSQLQVGRGAVMLSVAADTATLHSRYQMMVHSGKQLSLRNFSYYLLFMLVSLN
jgi:hypothetical protein